MRDVVLDSPLLLCALVVLFGALASLFPVSPVEPVLVGVAAVAPPWLLMPLVVLATASHMATKTLVFLGGSRVERAFNPRNRARVERIRVRLSGSQRLQQSTLFLSSVSGLPPFYLTTALCGTLRMPLRQFLMVATTGRAIRFAILIFVPQLLWAQPAPDLTRGVHDRLGASLSQAERYAARSRSWLQRRALALGGSSPVVSATIRTGGATYRAAGRESVGTSSAPVQRRRGAASCGTDESWIAIRRAALCAVIQI